MGNHKSVYSKVRIDVWILPNQIADIAKLKETTGKSQTDIVIEALGIYFNMMRKERVL